jgi:cytidine deaminase
MEETVIAGNGDGSKDGLSQQDWEELARLAWRVREAARAKTRVGCAVLSKRGGSFVGCNVEHRFRSHDIHAEVNAISSMGAGGDPELRAVIVVADREQFTPCGACMDWIFELGGPACFVAFDNGQGRIILRAADLMPYYPH